MIIQLSVILANSFSVSYFTYRDEYWTIYYVKPYARIPAFLIGVLAGCAYYSFKREVLESSRMAQAISKAADSNLMTVIWNVIGNTLMILMVALMQAINNAEKVAMVWNLFYLLFNRVLFVFGFTLLILPLLAGNAFQRPLSKFLSHDFWVPFSRLTYGAFLSHGCFMLFREYNTERGQWGCAFDAILFFLAFLTFSYVFSFFTFIFIEQPIASMIKEFAIKKTKY